MASFLNSQDNESTENRGTDNMIYLYYDINLDEEILILGEIAYFLHTIGTIILFVLSLPNLVLIYILMNKKHRRTNIGIYLLTLAVSDFFVMVKVLKVAITFMTAGYDNFYAECLTDKLLLFGTIWSPLIQAVVGIERALSVVLPHKVHLFCNVKVAKIVVVLTGILQALYIMVHATTIEYAPLETAGQLTTCIMNKEFVYVYFLYITWIVLVVHNVFPTVSILISSIILVKHLLFGKKDVQSSAKRSVKRRVTVLIFVLNVIYLLTTLPYAIHYQWSSHVQFSDLQSVYLHGNVGSILLFVSTINNASNFYVYFLSGSKFRGEMKLFFFKDKKKNR